MIFLFLVPLIKEVKLLFNERDTAEAVLAIPTVAEEPRIPAIVAVLTVANVVTGVAIDTFVTPLAIEDEKGVDDVAIPLKVGRI